jgi:predicted aldo/keto reductase-like oxidoreductase
MSRRKNREDADSSIERRGFLKLGAAATVGSATATVASGATSRTLPAMPSGAVTETAMPTRNLGRTGHRVGIFSLGGQAAVEQPSNEAVAVPIVERAIDLGINYIDTAARYGGDERWSQRYVGQVMKRRRAEVFLATKTHERTRDGSLQLLDESLKLLQTDHLDLWQIHNLSRMEQVDQIFADDGAVKALVQAREQKIVRHLGVTGHADPDVLIEAIRRFPFDTVLMALNAADGHHLSFTEKLLPLAVEKEMGIIGMKIPARGRILSSWTPPPPSEERSWAGGSRPGTLDMREAMRYVMSLPVSTVIVGCDSIEQLEENVRIAHEFNPLNETEMAELAKKTEPIHRQALFFRRWS